MAASVEIVCGPAGSGKTERLLTAYRQALVQAHRAGLAGNTLWLTPHHRARQAIRQRLLDKRFPAVIAPNVETFDGFAEKVLRLSPRLAQPLATASQRRLLRRIIDKLAATGKLAHFGSVARTRGFLDLVVTLIAELKRSETWPEAFAEVCGQRGDSPRDSELAQIYAEYQSALNANTAAVEPRSATAAEAPAAAFYDSEGLFWAALNELELGHWDGFRELSLVVADGFTDFTPSQLRIIKLIAGRAEKLLVSLPLERPLARSDLFAKSEAALGQLKTIASDLGVSVAVTEAASAQQDADGFPAVTHTARWLFGNPRETPLSATTEGVEVLRATGQLGEVQALAARVKSLLLAGVSAGEIVVAFRRVSEYAELVEEVFTACGLPYALPGGSPLSRCGSLRTLLDVLHLELEDWPFGRLMAILTSGWFRPEWREWRQGLAARAVNSELRRLKLHEHRSQILKQLKLAAEPPVAESDSAPIHPRDVVAADRARQAHRFLARLAQATQVLREPRDALAWARSLAALARDLGLNPQATQDSDSPAPDRRAWTLFERLLFDAANTESRLLTPHPSPLAPHPFPLIPLSDFLADLTDLVESSIVPAAINEVGRVLVLDAAQVRSLDVPYLFVAGLSESSFPSRRGDDCLFGEAERQELNRLGVPLGQRSSHVQDEMLLFYGLVTRARRKLVLSYPAVSASGQPLLPSPYLAALTGLFEAGALRTTRLEELDPVAPDAPLLCAADLRTHAVQAALSGRPELLAAAFRDTRFAPALGNVLAAVDMNVARFHTRGFTAVEGMLEQPANLAALREHFAPEREFSATQLEDFAQCPFRYLLQHVLKIAPLEGTTPETDRRRRGTLVHALLADLHGRSLSARTDVQPVPLASEELAMQFRELVQAKLGRRTEVSDVQQALLEVEQRLLDEMAGHLGRQSQEYAEAFGEYWSSPPRPAALEMTFGQAGSDAPQPSAFAALRFGQGAESVLVGGRIDRVDVGQADGQMVYNVVDYKTGNQRGSAIEDVASGRALQLAVYALAVARLQIAGPRAQPFQMGYWCVGQTGFVPGLKVKRRTSLAALEQAVWETLVETLEDIVPRLAAAIRTGRFPVYNADQDCASRCDYHTVCRVNQIRPLAERLEKQWAP